MFRRSAVVATQREVKHEDWCLLGCYAVWLVKHVSMDKLDSATIRFEVFTGIAMKNAVFWDVMQLLYPQHKYCVVNCIVTFDIITSVVNYVT
jgi:hypothetical protein